MASHITSRIKAKLSRRSSAETAASMVLPGRAMDDCGQSIPPSLDQSDRHSLPGTPSRKGIAAFTTRKFGLNDAHSTSLQSVGGNAANDSPKLGSKTKRGDDVQATRDTVRAQDRRGDELVGRYENGSAKFKDRMADIHCREIWPSDGEFHEAKVEVLPRKIQTRVGLEMDPELPTIQQGPAGQQGRPINHHPCPQGRTSPPNPQEAQPEEVEPEGPREPEDLAEQPQQHPGGPLGEDLQGQIQHQLTRHQEPSAGANTTTDTAATKSGPPSQPRPQRPGAHLSSSTQPVAITIDAASPVSPSSQDLPEHLPSPSQSPPPFDPTTRDSDDESAASNNSSRFDDDDCDDKDDPPLLHFRPYDDHHRHRPSHSHGSGRSLEQLSLESVAEPEPAADAASRSPSVSPPALLRKPPSVSFTLPRQHKRQSSSFSNRYSYSYSSFVSTSPYHPSADRDRRINSDEPTGTKMVNRKIWVKRPSASATLISIGQDDLVDDVREMILRKYANSLGRTFDAPDLTIRVAPRDHQKDRILGPEEHIGRALDNFFPGGQSVDEALIIDIPRRTPVASPRPPGQYPTTAIYLTEDGRPSEGGEGYFPPVGSATSPRIPLTMPAQANGAGPHSIAVLGTGHIPNIPSPGGTRPRGHRERSDRPKFSRNHTSSPTFRANGPPNTLSATANHDHFGMPPMTAGRPKSPGGDLPKVQVATPPARISSPRSSSSRPKKKKNMDYSNAPSSMLNGTVPPINVLIVEDNPINLKLLEAFVKRLKVRWQTAMNGREAVQKWRTGGFHLVLMDIQLPIMNGLQATREIRRLEMVNSIGVFSSAPVLEAEAPVELSEQDRLENPSLFKSPVIIVALTASSLQSDRHEALAAGCNDFLTKPVNFVWLERKVMEWGCMQALIDFDGWRQWKDYTQQFEEMEANKRAASKLKSKKARSSLASTAT